jgi:NitT/TauT family transport system substrate-binding protein
MRTRHKFLGVVACTFLVLLAGCAPKPTEKVSLRLGYAPIADAAQIYVAIENGYFSEQGIEIRLEQLGSGARILEAVGVGSVELGLSSYVPLVLASASGVQLQAITGGPIENKDHPEHAILVKKDSPIHSIDDLVGKTVALNGRRNIDHMIFQELLDKHSLPEDKVRIVEIPFPRMETVLDAGEVDAACAIEPFVTRAVEHGNMRILMYNFLALYDRIPIACYVATTEWIKKNGDVVRRFRTAFRKATEFCLAHPDENSIIIGKYTKLPEEELSKAGLPTFAAETSPTELQDLIERMLKRGLITRKMDARSLVYVN